MKKYTGQHRKDPLRLVRHDPLGCEMCRVELRHKIDERRDELHAHDGTDGRILSRDPGDDHDDSGDALRIHPMDDQTLLTVMADQW